MSFAADSTIAKTTALALRVVPYSNTSHVVTWMSQDRGRLTTIIKGACRPKSSFLGQYDLGYTCELLFYTRERGDLYIAREAAAIDERRALRTSAAHATAASYLCYLGMRVSHPHHPDLETYAILEAALDEVADGAGPTPGLLLWTELQLLGAQGLAPRLRQCASCARQLAGFESTRFSPPLGGLLCDRCLPRDAHCPQLGRDVLALMREWTRLRQPDALRRVRCSTKQLFQFRAILGSFLAYHMDVAPSCRDVAYGIVEA